MKELNSLLITLMGKYLPLFYPLKIGVFKLKLSNTFIKDY